MSTRPPGETPRCPRPTTLYPAEAGRIRRTELGVGDGQHPPLAHRAAVRRLSRPAGSGHRGGALEGARRRLLRRPRVRHRRPAGQDVPGRHQRPERADDGRERARPGRLRHAGEEGPTPRRSCAIARDTRHNSPEFAALCARVLAAAGLQGLPVSRAALDPPALVRGPASQVRRRNHDHRLAQPAVGQRVQVLRRTGGQVVPPDDAGIIECVKAASDREIPEKPL